MHSAFVIYTSVSPSCSISLLSFSLFLFPLPSHSRFSFLPSSLFPQLSLSPIPLLHPSLSPFPVQLGTEIIGRMKTLLINVLRAMPLLEWWKENITAATAGRSSVTSEQEWRVRRLVCACVCVHPCVYACVYACLCVCACIHTTSALIVSHTQMMSICKFLC